MEPATKAKMKEIMNSSDGVNKKLEAILSLLTLANLCYGIVLKPAELLVHPQNRGGQMCNPFDVHKKGSTILQSGLKVDLLGPSSVAIELSQNPTKREEQLNANQKMIDAPEGMLGHMTKQERYLTLGNSHMVMFCRAMEQQALDPAGGALHTPPELEQLLKQGWRWQVLHPSVEESFPQFPAFCQSSLNSVNNNSTHTAELESMLLLSNYVQKGCTMKQAVDAVKAAQPSCGSYLEDIAHFCQYYFGGETFPLLSQLRDFSVLPYKGMSMQLSFSGQEEKTNIYIYVYIYMQFFH